ncbi:hypothetical protein JCGZ_03586 [Jatropha curcas]|uniref:Uncharacterized protein n=1 Tax=Jatropha curcas TaxID=180498 RepID=A0A067JD49_JATCU|nr:hypothetical protein JCGZ_03586 [Jatropha curcas]
MSVSDAIDAGKVVEVAGETGVAGEAGEAGDSTVRVAGTDVGTWIVGTCKDKGSWIRLFREFRTSKKYSGTSSVILVIFRTFQVPYWHTFGKLPKWPSVRPDCSQSEKIGFWSLKIWVFTGSSQSANAPSTNKNTTTAALNLEATNMPQRRFFNFDTPISRVFDKLKAIGLLRPLVPRPPPTPLPRNIDQSAYYHFHQSKGHTTGNCLRLRHEI